MIVYLPKKESSHRAKSRPASCVRATASVRAARGGTRCTGLRYTMVHAIYAPEVPGCGCLIWVREFKRRGRRRGSTAAVQSAEGRSAAVQDVVEGFYAPSTRGPMRSRLGTVVTLLALWGCAYALPFYLPPGEFALKIGGKTAAALFTNLFDAGGFTLCFFWNSWASKSTKGGDFRQVLLSQALFGAISLVCMPWCMTRQVALAKKQK